MESGLKTVGKVFVYTAIMAAVIGGVYYLLTLLHPLLQAVIVCLMVGILIVVGVRLWKKTTG